MSLLPSGGPSLTATRNQINPLTKLLMIVLRIAIGWHLLYEGYSKISSTMEGKKPFSAEMYLRQSTGRFGSIFVAWWMTFMGWHSSMPTK